MTSPTERQARIIWLAATGLAIAVLVFLVAVLVWGLGRALDLLSPVLWPLAVAGVIAYLLDPVVDWFERRRLSRARASPPRLRYPDQTPPLPPHARLKVCRLDAGEQTIHQASVVRCAAMGGQWYLGCSLDHRLEEAELRAWLLPRSTPDRP